MITETTGRPSSAGWFTSSHSNQINACVQVRFVGGTVQVADSKDRGRGPVITVPGRAWDAFVAAALGAPAAVDAVLASAPAPDGGRTVTGPDGTELRYTRVEWSAFLAGAADGEFRRPAAA
jgi:Domain of unknown function (DUF397)